MTTPQDLRACSRQLLESAGLLEALIGETASSAAGGAQAADIAARSRRIHDGMRQVQSRLLALGKGSLDPALQGRAAKRAMAAALAEFPLSPGCQALHEVASLVEEGRAATAAGRAVLLVPLTLAYRHCVESLGPLATAMDPRDEVQG